MLPENSTLVGTYKQRNTHPCWKSPYTGHVQTLRWTIRENMRKRRKTVRSML